MLQDYFIHGQILLRYTKFFEQHIQHLNQWVHFEILFLTGSFMLFCKWIYYFIFRCQSQMRARQRMTLWLRSLVSNHYRFLLGVVMYSILRISGHREKLLAHFYPLKMENCVWCPEHHCFMWLNSIINSLLRICTARWLPSQFKISGNYAEQCLTSTNLRSQFVYVSRLEPSYHSFVSSLVY